MSEAADIAKISAAAAALDQIRDGMIVGLGTGSTAAHFVRLLGQRALDGLRVKCVPTSERTRELAEIMGLELLSMDKVSRIDVTVDGADEIDPAFRLLKGAGGALLREKIVAAASDHLIVIADESKLVDVLGAAPLPVEVTPFGVATTAQKIYSALKAAGCAGREAALREAGGKPYLTDQGHHILDCRCAMIPDPEALDLALNAIPGVVEHGLFLGLARTIIIGRPRGAEIREKQ